MLAAADDDETVAIGGVATGAMGSHDGLVECQGYGHGFGDDFGLVAVAQSRRGVAGSGSFAVMLEYLF